MLLRTEQLTKCYGKITALDRLDLEASPGEIVGILGPNGSGKSTALRILLGFLRPSAGRAWINGHDCWADSVNARRFISYLPGELRLYENMTGTQVINFLCDLRRHPPSARVEQLAQQFDIDIARPLSQMSSGMKRKIALMQVLLPETPLVILDEPTNTLDPTMRDQLLDQLVAAKKRGQTVLFSSHVLSEVERVCDRVAILKQGRLVHWQPMSSLREGRHVQARLTRGVPISLPSGAVPHSVESHLHPSLPGRGAGGEGENQSPKKETNITALGPRDAPSPPAPSPRGEVSIDFDYAGPLPDLLRWLSELPIADLRIEPMGLTNIYQQFHRTDEATS